MMAGRMRPSFVAVVVGTSLALSSIGCKRGARQVEEKPVANSITDRHPPLARLDGAGGTITVSSEAGAISATLSALLPEDFPKVIPIYAGAKVVFAAKSSQAEGAPSWTATLESGDAKDRIVDFYKQGMAAFKLATSMDMAETSMCVWQGPHYDATLMATTEADQKTTFTLTVTGK
jgi:hypothetical protein